MSSPQIIFPHTMNVPNLFPCVFGSFSMADTRTLLSFPTPYPNLIPPVSIPDDGKKAGSPTVPAKKIWVKRPRPKLVSEGGTLPNRSFSAASAVDSDGFTLVSPKKRSPRTRAPPSLADPLHIAIRTAQEHGFFTPSRARNFDARTSVRAFIEPRDKDVAFCLSDSATGGYAEKCFKNCDNWVWAFNLKLKRMCYNTVLNGICFSFRPRYAHATLLEFVEHDPRLGRTLTKTLSLFSRGYGRTFKHTEGFCWVDFLRPILSTLPNSMLDRPYISVADIKFFTNESRLPTNLKLTRTGQRLFHVDARGSFMLDLIPDDAYIGASNSKLTDEHNDDSMYGQIVNTVLNKFSITKYDQFSGFLDKQLHNLLCSKHENFESKSPVIITVVLTPEEKDTLSKAYPEFRIHFKDSVLSSHGFLNASRTLENELFYFKFRSVNYIDIGGSVVYHFSRGHFNVHCCNPILDSKDSPRFYNAILRLSSHNFSKDKPMSSVELRMHKFLEDYSSRFCTLQAHICEFKANYACAVQVYDLNVRDFGEIMVKRGIQVCFVSFVYAAELLAECDEILCAKSNMLIRREGVFSVFFPNGSGDGYKHDRSNIESFFRTRSFVTPNGSHYSVEFVEDRADSKIFMITKTVMESLVHSKSRLIPRVQTNKVIINIPIVDQNSRRTKKLIVDKDFMARVTLYALNACPVVNDRTFETIVSNIRSQKTHVVVAGKVIHSQVELTVEECAGLAAAVLANATRQRSVYLQEAKRIALLSSTPGILKSIKIFVSVIFDSIKYIFKKLWVTVVVNNLPAFIRSKFLNDVDLISEIEEFIEISTSFEDFSLNTCTNFDVLGTYNACFQDLKENLSYSSNNSILRSHINGGSGFPGPTESGEKENTLSNEEHHDLQREGLFGGDRDNEDIRAEVEKMYERLGLEIPKVKKRLLDSNLFGMVSSRLSSFCKDFLPCLPSFSTCLKYGYHIANIFIHKVLSKSLSCGALLISGVFAVPTKVISTVTNGAKNALFYRDSGVSTLEFQNFSIDEISKSLSRVEDVRTAQLAEVERSLKCLTQVFGEERFKSMISSRGNTRDSSVLSLCTTPFTIGLVLGTFLLVRYFKPVGCSDFFRDALSHCLTLKSRMANHLDSKFARKRLCDISKILNKVSRNVLTVSRPNGTVETFATLGTLMYPVAPYVCFGSTALGISDLTIGSAIFTLFKVLLGRRPGFDVHTLNTSIFLLKKFGFGKRILEVISPKRLDDDADDVSGGIFRPGLCLPRLKDVQDPMLEDSLKLKNDLDTAKEEFNTILHMFNEEYVAPASEAGDDETSGLGAHDYERHSNPEPQVFSEPDEVHDNNDKTRDELRTDITSPYARKVVQTFEPEEEVQIEAFLDLCFSDTTVVDVPYDDAHTTPSDEHMQRDLIDFESPLPVTSVCEITEIIEESPQHVNSTLSLNHRADLTAPFTENDDCVSIASCDSSSSSGSYVAPHLRDEFQRAISSRRHKDELSNFSKSLNASSTPPVILMKGTVFSYNAILEFYYKLKSDVYNMHNSLLLASNTCFFRKGNLYLTDSVESRNKGFAYADASTKRLLRNGKTAPGTIEDYRVCFSKVTNTFLLTEDALKSEENIGTLLVNDGCKLFQEDRIHKCLDVLNMDAQFVQNFFKECSVRTVNAPPGGGKTYTLVEHAFKASKMGTSYAVCTANRSSAQNIVKKLSTKLKVKEQQIRKKVRTGDSWLINGTYKVDKLFVDEYLMFHLGQLLSIIISFKPKNVILYGDINQIRFINRNVGLICRFDDTTRMGFPTEHLSISYRCPADVCYFLSTHLNENKQLSYPEGVKSKAEPTILKSVSKRSISAAVDIDYKEYDGILTFTQEEKKEVMAAIKINHKGFDASIVKTVHEAQGETFKSVALVRTKAIDDNIYDSKSHILVAISRHTHSFRYYVISKKLNDSVGKHVDELSTLKESLLQGYVVNDCS
ncbi:polyprotein [Mint vein banding-associated virus]|uniref:Polyprotein n=1 Tax=Mint vein banding-associated virus TaxID=265877 RepID=Q6QCI4_9CLOS|nr:polyprotein [Mint vein banding-associated virus]AAS57938.4 polyprotein [Mint vein banding-associated virus]